MKIELRTYLLLSAVACASALVGCEKEKPPAKDDGQNNDNNDNDDDEPGTGACANDAEPVVIADEAPSENPNFFRFLGSVAVDGDYVYYAVDSVDLTEARQVRLRRVPKAGGAVETVFEGSGSTNLAPTGFDADHVYFSYMNPNYEALMLRVPKDGGDPVIVVSGNENLWVSETLLDGDFIYAAAGDAESDMVLARFPKGGGAHTPLLGADGIVAAFPQDQPQGGILVTPTGFATDAEFLYAGASFDNPNTPNGAQGGAYVYRIPKTGAELPTWIATVPLGGMFGHTAHVVGTANGRVYWEDQEAMVWSAPVAGGEPTAVVEYQDLYGPSGAPGGDRVTQVVLVAGNELILKSVDYTRPVDARLTDLTSVNLGTGVSTPLGQVRGVTFGDWDGDAVDDGCIYLATSNADGSMQVSRVKR
jgi:hypothetical protein